MKILTIGNFNYGWDGSICDEEHIAQALQELGHEVTRVQRESHREIMHKEASGTLEPYDFILIAQWDGYDADLLEIYKRGQFLLNDRKCPLVYWAFDHQADGQAWHERLISVADLYLSKRIADSKYDNWQWLCQDFAPGFLDKYPDAVEQDIDILFTGSWLPWATERNNLLLELDYRYNLSIYSFNMNDWPQTFKNVHHAAMDDQLPKLVARSKINISIDHTLETGYWSDRNAQIMACGGLVLFRYIACSTQVFGDHVDYFYDQDSCFKKIDYYLENPEHREHRANRGYRYAQDNLMAIDRVKDLLTIVGAYL